jgi:hypothetical protein
MSEEGGMDLETLRKPLVYATAGMKLAAVRADLPCHTDTNDRLRMDGYLPTGRIPAPALPAL